jgi:uncharacterized membrane protein
MFLGDVASSAAVDAVDALISALNYLSHFRVWGAIESIGSDQRLVSRAGVFLDSAALTKS